MTIPDIALVPSSDEWLDKVLGGFDEFLLDHAANEKKASAMAMTMVAHYPDRQTLVNAMINLAVEELQHFREVAKLIEQRGLIMSSDEKDPYMNAMRKAFNKDNPDEYLLDRLLLGAVVEARGEERFRRIAGAVKDERLSTFYRALANSEAGHHQQFVNLARHYYPGEQVSKKITQWINLETETIAHLPIRCRLH